MMSASDARPNVPMRAVIVTANAMRRLRTGRSTLSRHHRMSTPTVPPLSAHPVVIPSDDTDMNSFSIHPGGVMSVLDPRPTIEAPDDDPYLWLEEIEGGRALAWVEAQNAATLRRLADAQFATDHDLLKTIFDRPDNIPYPYRRGGQILNVWQDDAHPRGLWRTTSLASFRSKTPAWDVVLDLDALAAQE